MGRLVLAAIAQRSQSLAQFGTGAASPYSIGLDQHCDDFRGISSTVSEKRSGVSWCQFRNVQLKNVRSNDIVWTVSGGWVGGPAFRISDDGLCVRISEGGSSAG